MVVAVPFLVVVDLVVATVVVDRVVVYCILTVDYCFLFVCSLFVGCQSLLAARCFLFLEGFILHLFKRAGLGPMLMIMPMVNTVRHEHDHDHSEDDGENFDRCNHDSM